MLSPMKTFSFLPVSRFITRISTRSRAALTAEKVLDVGTPLIYPE